MTEFLHPFEKAGLGLAPFRYDGMSEITFQAAPGEPIRAGGSCDYCGTGIRNAFWIKSADGKRFKVGCDCVEKTCKPGGPIITAVQKAARAHQKKLTADRLKMRIVAATQRLAADPVLLTDRLSPWRNLDGTQKTSREMVDFLFECGGAAGKTKACKIVEAAP